MRRTIAPLLILCVALLSSSAHADDATVATPRIHAKASGLATRTTPAEGGTPSGDAGLQPDIDVIDAPTSSVLDYGGYSTRSRFYSQGGLLEYISFGVYPGLNLGASAAVDGLIGNESDVRVRAPAAQVRYRFFDGDAALPSLAVGYDGQGYLYNSSSERFNERQRGFYVVGSKEIGVPGLQIHPSINVSDFNSNSIYGALPLTLNIRDKAEVLAEWDNIADFSHSRLNLGLRAYLTPSFEVDFGVRSIGGGGLYSDGQRRGPERIVQLKYAGNF
jgi:hypothetical protein